MTPTWRISSYSNNGECVEVAKLPDGRTAVRNSNHPDAGTLQLAPAQWSALLTAAKAGELA